MITIPAISTAAETGIPALPPVFPVDLSAWLSGADLLRVVTASAARSGGASWLNLISDAAPERPANDLLVLLTYCYLQSTYHSIDVLRRLESDPALREMRERTALRTEQIRRFRRDCRRELTDSLTRSLLALWQRRIHPAGLPVRSPIAHDGARPDFAFLEPFYLQAQDRIDRAVVFDSMAQDE